MACTQLNAFDRTPPSAELKLITEYLTRQPVLLAYRMKNSELELHTDYLLSSFGATTATGLSAMVQGDVSHDRITRFLSGQDYTSKDLWLQVKAMVREVENAQGMLIFDDTIQEKAWTDESDLICWHYDHCSGRTV